jgi:tubulin polyglutamylase TTLL9
MQRPSRPSGSKTYYFRTCLHNTIHRVLQNRPNWVETDSDVVRHHHRPRHKSSTALCVLQDFDFVWADKQWMSDHFDGLRLQDHQRVNHFRNHYELTRKDLLIKNLKRIKKQLEKEDR